MDNESKLSAALARAKQGRLDAALAKVRTRNVDARLGALFQNYTGDPTAPMMRQQVDQARDLAARGMIAPEQIAVQQTRRVNGPPRRLPIDVAKREVVIDQVIGDAPHAC